MKQWQVLRTIFPAFITENFEFVDYKECDNRLDYWLDERGYMSREDYKKGTVREYGFTEERVIQDFPLRGKAVFLHVRRRKWRDTDDGSIFTYDYDMTEDGSRLTPEFVAFLKEEDWIHPREHPFDSGSLWRKRSRSVKTIQGDIQRLPELEAARPCRGIHSISAEYRTKSGHWRVVAELRRALYVRDQPRRSWPQRSAGGSHPRHKSRDCHRRTGENTACQTQDSQWNNPRPVIIDDAHSPALIP